LSSSYSDLAKTASYFNQVYQSNTISSSWSSASLSSSYSATASYALNGGGSSLITGSTYPITSSWSNNSISSSHSLTASYALNGGSGGPSISSSWASSSLSSSYSLTSSYVENYVPYNNATSNVNLGNNSITASNLLVVSASAPINPMVGKLWYDPSDDSSISASIVSYPVQTVSSGFKTLSSSDAFTYIRLTNATSCSITVTSQSVTIWPTTVDIAFRIAGAGLPNFVTASTITINNASAATTFQQHDVFVLKKIATDVWDLI
jgi:hypothetical protein